MICFDLKLICLSTCSMKTTWNRWRDAVFSLSFVWCACARASMTTLWKQFNLQSRIVPHSHMEMCANNLISIVQLYWRLNLRRQQVKIIVLYEHPWLDTVLGHYFFSLSVQMPFFTIFFPLNFSLEWCFFLFDRGGT